MVLSKPRGKYITFQEFKKWARKQGFKNPNELLNFLHSKKRPKFIPPNADIYYDKTEYETLKKTDKKEFKKRFG
tara:strand:+ start:230 stop:451 length:222 start_codon:yes stop_codon:yes gene_type:complete